MCKRLHNTLEVYPNSNGLETIYNLAGASEPVGKGLNLWRSGACGSGFFLNVRHLPDGLRRSACIFHRTACAVPLSFLPDG